MRIIFILGALFSVAIVGAFFLYVSVLSIVTAITIMIGLVATLVLGYWAGSNSREASAARMNRAPDQSVINAPGDVSFVRDIPLADAKPRVRIDPVLARGPEGRHYRAVSER